MAESVRSMKSMEDLFAPSTASEISYFETVYSGESEVTQECSGPQVGFGVMTYYPKATDWPAGQTPQLGRVLQEIVKSLTV